MIDGSDQYGNQLIPQKGPETKVTGRDNEVEIWKLRCKLMAEKYFSIIKDLKHNLQKMKDKSMKQIKKAKKEIGDSLLDELKGFIDRLETERRTQKMMRNAKLDS